MTDELGLTDDILRLCAATGATADVVSGKSAMRPRMWRSAAAVLVGADAAEAIAQVRLPRRDGVVLISNGSPASSLWQQAVTIRAESVAVLPEAAPELVRRLSDLLEGTHSACLTLGVVGARGGSGASTLAAGLAMTAARRKAATLLIDADPLGGGIDLVVGIEDLDGLRWPEVASAAGRVSSSALRAALPGIDDLAVLSWDRAANSTLDASMVRSILAAAQRGSRLVVIDLPRRMDAAATEAAVVCDVVLVLCPTDVRAAAGAVLVAAPLRELRCDLRLVVRSGLGPAVDGGDLAALVDLALLGSLPTKTSVARLADEGLGIPSRGQYADACRALLEDLGVLEVRV